MNDTYSRFALVFGAVVAVLGVVGALVLQRNSFFGLTVIGLAVIAIGVATGRGESR